MVNIKRLQLLIKSMWTAAMAEFPDFLTFIKEINMWHKKIACVQVWFDLWHLTLCCSDMQADPVSWLQPCYCVISVSVFTAGRTDNETPACWYLIHFVSGDNVLFLCVFLVLLSPFVFFVFLFIYVFTDECIVPMLHSDLSPPPLAPFDHRIVTPKPHQISSYYTINRDEVLGGWVEEKLPDLHQAFIPAFPTDTATHPL